MAYKYREEIVGKRFLCVCGSGKLKLGKISDWEWRTGVVRAVSGKDCSSVELSILVEYDGKSWQRREWIKVHEIYQVFLVEHTLVWVSRQDPYKSSYHEVNWPALSFKSLVDRVGISGSKQRPIEFLVDHELGLVDEADIIYYQEGDENSYGIIRSYPDLKKAIKSWVDYQDGQKILLTTPTVLVGYRVEVYRAEGTTQWYTAVIQAYNHSSKTIAVTDDTVLEEHNEDPALNQMHLIDDGVVDSILRGVDVGIIPRRRPRNTKEQEQRGNTNAHHNTRQRSQSPFQCTPSNKLVGARKTRQRNTSGGNNTDCDRGLDKSSVKGKSNLQKEKKRKVSCSTEDLESVGLVNEKCIKACEVGLQNIAKHSHVIVENIVPIQNCKTESKKPKFRARLRNKHIQDDRDIVHLDAFDLADSHKQEEEDECCSSKLAEGVEKSVAAELNKRGKETCNDGSKEKTCLPVETSLVSTGLGSISEKRANTVLEIKKVEGPVEDAISCSLRGKDSASSSCVKHPEQEFGNCGKPQEDSEQRQDSLCSKAVDISTPNERSVQCKNVLKETSLCIIKNRKLGEKHKENHICSLKKSKAVDVSVKSNQCLRNKKSPDNGVKTLLEQSILAGIQDNMHFKKQFLLSRSNSSEKPSHTSLTANIDVNHSVTDQIAKLAKAEKLANTEENAKGSFGCKSSGQKDEATVNKKFFAEQSEGKSIRLLNQRTSPHIEKMNYTTSQYWDERYGSQYVDWRSASLMDEVKNVKPSPASSPLIIDRHEPVNPYRDPELMRKNPVHSMLAHHKPLSQTTYPSVPTAIPAGHGTLPVSTSLSSHPLSRTLLTPMHFSHQLSSLGSMSPHISLPHAAIGQMEASNLAARALSSIPQQQQPQHQSHIAALQYSNAHLQLLSSYMTLHGNLTPAQLELLWQQKYPSIPVPPSYMLVQYQDDLIHDASLLHERELERERLERHERLEKERIERRLEREQAERLERERKEIAEREKMERERAEREKAEKERLEREKQERELQESSREREQRQRVVLQEAANERTRLKEATAAAVNKHFIESLKLVSQRVSRWPSPSPSPSITLGTGKGLVGKAESQLATAGFPQNVSRTDRPNSIMDEMKAASDKLKHEKEEKQESYLHGVPRSSYVEKHGDVPSHHHHLPHHQDERLVRHQTPHQNQMMYESHLKMMSEQQRAEAKSEVVAKTDDKPYQYSTHTDAVSHLSRSNLVQQVKQEQPNFSLYGYQPFQHSYISSDQLTLRGLANSDKNASGWVERPHDAVQPSVKKKDISVPPPLIKDNKSHNTVIVENKSRDGTKSASPHNFPYGSPAPSKSNSPTRQIAYSERLPERPLSSSSSSISPSLSHGSAQTSSSSPLRNVSAHSPHISAFIAAEKSAASRSQSPLRIASPQQLSAAVLQQPLDYRKTMATSSWSNPVNMSSAHYTSPQAASSSSQVITVSSPHMASSPVSSAAHTYSLIQQSYKVSNPIYSQSPVPSGRNEDTHASSTLYTQNAIGSPLSSTQQGSYSSNASGGVKRKPVRDGAGRKKAKSDAALKGPPVSDPVTVPVTTPQIFSNPSPYTTSSSSGTSIHPTVSIPSTLSTPTMQSAAKATGFMDSFRSFVENTVQNAFYQDTDVVLAKRKNNAETVSPPASVPKFEEAGGNSSLTALASSSNSSGSKLANGQTDTDSDTLSAPSPPPSLKPEACPSPGRSGGNHTKLKKAWLQRHSDEDKGKEPSIKKEEPGEEKGDVLKTCYVNCSYISPSKEGGTKSPITSIMLTNGNIKEGGVPSDESTSSASETEAQQGVDESVSGAKRRIKTKKHETDSTLKKIKLEPVDDYGNCSSRKKSTSGKKIKGERDVQKSKGRDSSDELRRNSDSYLSENSMEYIKTEHLQQFPDGDFISKEKKRNRRGKEATKEMMVRGLSVSHYPPVKASIATLKRTCEPFFQDGPCSEVTPKLMKCRECRLTPTQRSKKLPNIFCRFYAFRKLRYSQKGYLTIAGFSELSDAVYDDIKAWLPRIPVIDPQIDVEMSKYIVTKVGDKFCELVEQEKEAWSWAGKDSKVAWKKAVSGVREMCDVCDTTLFNIHWVCHKCGFVACLDCYKTRVKLDKESFTSTTAEEHEWLTCSANRQPHEPEKLMLTQIIPCDALWELGKLIHEMRTKWGIRARCPCGKNNDPVVQKNGVNQQLIKQAINHISPEKSKKLANGLDDDSGSNNAKGRKSGSCHRSAQQGNLTSYNPDNNSPLCLLADVASMNSRDHSKAEKQSCAADPVSPQTTDVAVEKKSASGCSTLRELLTKTAGKVKPGSDSKKTVKPKSVRSTLDDIIQSVVEKNLPKETETSSNTLTLRHYVPKMGPVTLARETPIFKHSLTETSVLYPDVPHSWLCDGRLLRLHDPKHKGNFKIFQEQWKRGQPVLASGVDNYLHKDIWKPESFSREFGEIENDLVNCRTGDVWIGHPMKVFWDGFEYLSKRLVNKNNEPMLLKLKDWPPGEDFSDLLPSLFQDLMQALPLPEYAHRQGTLNLASRLPDFLVKPDLGPKMYNAYGSANYPSEGTTNLHLDVSDAVNVMVYVGIPEDGPSGRKEHEEAALRAIDEAGCDVITKKRVREVHEVPGALWHIYDADDADKIRDLLNKVAKENGQTIEPDHDPIHDQSWYLEEQLRVRLHKEYGVLGYTLVQCLGDAVFIPAGAPHQVRNLYSCIKIAEDFVSPEHLNHCFRLTQEFRHLSHTHSNHEDKLQVKNIIYHAVKDALAMLNDSDPPE